MRSLTDEAADGPRLFSLVPVGSTALNPQWTKRRMRLTLYCEHSRWPVHALDPEHPGTGTYELDIPRDWWTKAVPLLRVTSALIKPFLGISLAATELDFSTTEWDAVKEQLAVGKETLTAAADLAGSADADGWDTDHTRHDTPVEAEGGLLRTLHVMLREQDPTFADLRRVTDTTGRYRWVHPRFIPIYQPPLPIIPSGPN